MLKTLGIVQLRRGDDQLANKARRKLGGKSLLEWVVRRVTDCQRLDGVVVVLEDTAEDGALRDLVPADVPVFVSRERDSLGRVVAALNEYHAKCVVRVCADNPFIDPVLIDRLVSMADTHNEADYIGYSSSDGLPAILSPLGVFAEWCSATALRTAERLSQNPLDREMVTRYLYTHPDQFRVRLLPVPAEMDRDDVRLKVDFEEDWEHAQAIYDALGPEEWDWQRIADLLDHQPALRKRMAVLNRSEAQL
jgi:spore coat polysaccharide biosynthesis protein SpsF